GTPYATSRYAITLNSFTERAEQSGGSFSIKSDLPIGSDKLDAISLKKRHKSIKVGYPNLIDDSQLRIRTGLPQVFHMHPANLGCLLGAREIRPSKVVIYFQINKPTFGFPLPHPPVRSHPYSTGHSAKSHGIEGLSDQTRSKASAPSHRGLGV
ncbi:MAG: hypothetical protein NBV68_00005, partial [Erythrobacter sp.]|uniref:hypothetical protein n=1 Tax=Erythrobacter sp. TaxID=1042 RepID=UPI0025E11F36